MEQMYIKPAGGTVVRDPATRQPLDAGGQWKPRTPYWRRRLRDESVMETAPPEETTAPKKKAATDNSGGDTP